MSQYRNPTLTTAPTAFSYTPTGRAIAPSRPLPSSPPLRTPNRRPASPSYTPTGRAVMSTPTQAAPGAA